MEASINLSSTPSCQDLPDYLHRNSCRLTSDDNGRLDAVAMVRMVSSVIGLLGACSIIVSTIIRKRVCSAEVHPIFMLSLADCLLSGLWISGSSIWLSDLNDKHYNSIYCYPITLLTGMLECVAVNLTLVYSVLAYLRTKNTELHTLLIPYGQKRREMNLKTLTLMYIIAWSFPVFLVSLVFGVSSVTTGVLSMAQSCSCWCRPTVVNVLPFAWSSDNESKSFMQKQIIFTVSLGCVIALHYIVVFCLLVILYVKTLIKIKDFKKEFESRHEVYSYGATAVLARGQSQAAKRVTLFLTVFVFSGFFNLCCTVFLVILVANIQDIHHFHNSFMHSSTMNGIYYSFLFAQSLTLPLQGFMNAIVYGWTREDFVSTISFPLRHGQEDDTFPDEHGDQEGSFTSSVESCTSPRLSLTDNIQHT